MADFKVIENGHCTTPAGFLASGIVAGLKRSGAPDMALLVSARVVKLSTPMTHPHSR